MHEHNSCEHELKYCKICDVVYCERCRREWIKGWTYVSYPQPYIGDGTVTNPKITYTYYTTNHTHGKDLE